MRADRAAAAQGGAANYAMLPYAITIALAAVYFRDLGVLGPRPRRAAAAGAASSSSGGGIELGGTAGAPAPGGVSISIVPPTGSGVSGAGGAEASPAFVTAAALGGAGGAAHSISFAFCDSWGYRKEAERQAQVLRALFPEAELRVQLGTYDVGALRRGAAQALNAAALAGVAYVFVGQAALGFMGVAEPQLLADFRENKLVGLGGYFAANFLGSQLKSSGAFEVAVDGAPVFSKLKSGRPPAAEEVVVAVVAAGARHDAAAAERIGFSFLNVGAGAAAGAGAGAGARTGSPRAAPSDEEVFETIPVAAAA